MTQTFNVYCDESAHLPSGEQNVMVLGAVWCPAGHAAKVASKIKQMRLRHGLAPNFEAKWTKVSPAKPLFYRELAELFFADDELRFRALVIPEKTQLHHEAFEQDHDTWYYKMYFSMLKLIITPKDRFCIYLDIKDTCSADKVRKLHEVLCSNIYDFRQQVIGRVQTVRSHEVALLQLADLLIGATRRAHTDPTARGAKDDLVKLVRHRSGYGLTRSTLPTEKKFNVFIWRPKAMAK